MSLRARLVLAFVLLAVIPLTAVTLYSYVASERAFRAAVQAEAGALADDMRERMGTVTADLEGRMAKLAEMPAPADAGEDGAFDAEDMAHLEAAVQRAVGAAAGLIESLEVLPQPPDAPEPPDIDLGTLPGGPALNAEVRAQIAQARRQAQEAAQQRRRGRHERAREQAHERAQEYAQQHAQEHAARVVMRRELDFPLRRGGRQVATVRANVGTDRLMRDVLGGRGHRPGEIPFAIDAAGTLHAADADRAQLQALSLTPAEAGASEALQARPDWIVVTRRDPASGLTMGVARPVREPLREIRRTALRNLGLGLGAVTLGLLGIVPLSRRITRELGVLTEGAEKLARGDLEARVPVRTRDEVGRLGEAFNRMAHELRENQDRLLAQERLQKELEMGRRIQEEMLPRDPLRVSFAEVKGVSIPAREVGGDFFNYFTLPGGHAALLVGDVSGKGVAAALLMANLQATLRARLPLERELPVLAAELDDEIAQTTGGGAYLTLFLGVLGPDGAMRYVSAGHNPPLALHADGRVQALQSTGRPLGLLAGGGYVEERVELAVGSSLFLYTDGVVESEDAAGEAFGPERLQAVIVQERTNGLDGILARVEDTVRAWRAGAEPADDATMVVLKVGVPATPA